MEYSFNVYNKLAEDGICMALHTVLTQKNTAPSLKSKGAGLSSTQNLQNSPYPAPVIVCVGSDLAIGDSLGPITGSMLKYKTQGLCSFLYGTLASPVTAKEIKYLRTLLKNTHKNQTVVVVDAAVGQAGDIGTIKITDSPLYPGAGANKKLGCIGDISIMGIVAEKSIANYALLNTTRLNLVYSMSEIIATALANVLYNL